MNLFSKDKELILKITNAILLIWFLSAIIFTSNNIVNMIIKEPVLTFEQYKSKYCSKRLLDEDQDYCQSEYNHNVLNKEDDIFRQKKYLFTSIIATAVPGLGMFFINRDNKKALK
ncbi:MAG: hypothetical protein PHF21_03470 [Bacilli bacterium]|nr:hypothetical protein [Bacilli bacterium]